MISQRISKSSANKVCFVIDERLRNKNYKHKDVLRSLKSCLGCEEALQYAEYVSRFNISFHIRICKVQPYTSYSEPHFTLLWRPKIEVLKSRLRGCRLLGVNSKLEQDHQVRTLVSIKARRRPRSDSPETQPWMRGSRVGWV